MSPYSIFIEKFAAQLYTKFFRGDSQKIDYNL